MNTKLPTSTYAATKAAVDEELDNVRMQMQRTRRAIKRHERKLAVHQRTEELLLQMKVNNVAEIASDVKVNGG